MSADTGAREALAQIAETARWYAENGDRQQHEVDHALCVEVLSIAENALDALAAGVGVPSPLVKGPTTYTTACTCDSQLAGYHRMGCGVYAGVGEARPAEPATVWEKPQSTLPAGWLP